jgi:hypothetical protein
MEKQVYYLLSLRTHYLLVSRKEGPGGVPNGFVPCFIQLFFLKHVNKLVKVHRVPYYQMAYSFQSGRVTRTVQQYHHHPMTLHAATDFFIRHLGATPWPAHHASVWRHGFFGVDILHSHRLAGLKSRSRSCDLTQKP